MRIKTKLTVAIGTLFVLISTLSVVAIFYINAMSNDTNNILEDNYNSLDYSKKMMVALDALPNDSNAIILFEANLLKQKNNITEKGEETATEKLVQNFLKIKQNKTDNVLAIEIRKNIAEIMQLNMEAIQYKNKIAFKTADHATSWIAIVATLCFLVSFSLLLNFPRGIANPIKELTVGIKEIADKNYKRRIEYESHDEFGEVAIAFNTMASKLKEYETSNLSEILFEKKRIETLINKMHNPIIGLNEHKKILFANEEASEILALKPEDIIGKDALDIAFSNDLMRKLMQELTAHQENKKVNNEHLKIYFNKKESYFEKEIIDIHFTPTGEKVSKLIGHVILLKDITPFKELDTLKTNFIGTVSHELKTPISSILMSLNLLEDKRVGSINKEQRLMIQNIKEDIERLLKITGELTNITQAETGNIQLSIQPSSPKEIVELAVNANKNRATQKNINIEIDCPETISSVLADTEKTAWVLNNFISNAIKYSDQDSKIMVTVKSTDDKIEFSVKDFGKGIDNKYTNKIFDRYFRIPGNDKEGTGLGLAICKEFIEAQKGSIGVISEPNKGSTFYFNLGAA
ncbi:MAG: ATP-binding protein [Chitinophagales bacterium]|nr:ATP-binding protein [Chitinophagales bacterium]